MWTIEDLLNILHHQLIERHVNHWWRALARHWRAIKARLPRGDEEDESQNLQKETHHMEEVGLMAMASVGRMLLAKIDAQSAAAVRAAVAEEIREEEIEQLRTDERTQARADLEEERERLRDQVEAEKEEVWNEIEDRLEAAREKTRAQLRDEFLEEIRELKAHVATLTKERDAAEGAALHLVEEVFPRDRFIYLRRAGVKRLDLTLLEPVLAKRKLRIKTELTKSPRTVDVVIAPGQPRARTLFMLESTIGADEEPSATSALPAHQESPS